MSHNENYSFRTLSLNILIVAVICFGIIQAPLLFAFKINYRPWQLWVEGFTSALLLGDIIYHSKINTFKRFDLVKKKIHSSWKNPLIYMEVCTALPWDFVVAFLAGPSLLVMFKALRIIRFMRFKKMFSLGDNLTMVPISVKIVGVGLFIIMAIHWIACGWVIANGTHATFTLADDYNMALYWAVTTLTTVGYGDVTPNSNLSRLYTMVIMICGVGVYGVVIGNVSHLLSMADRYNEQSREKIQDLNMFMKHYSIPLKLQRAAFNYYNHLYAKRLSDNDSKIIADLPSALKTDIQTYMNIKLIGEIPLFQNCSHKCLTDIASSLQQLSFSPSQYIIRAGEIGNEMFIISHGKVDILNQDKEYMASLQDGKFFGETALIEHTTRNTHVKANTYCDVYKLSKDDFLTIIKKHPDLLANMEKVLNKKFTHAPTKKIA